MATHIHIHGGRGGGKTQRTVDAIASATREGKKVIQVSKTRDCGCGGHVKDKKPTRDAGEPVNGEWMKLDRMTPDDLSRAASAKNITAEGKTDTIMGILRATFNPNQIEAWSLYF